MGMGIVDSGSLSLCSVRDWARPAKPPTTHTRQKVVKMSINL